MEVQPLNKCSEWQASRPSRFVTGVKSLRYSRNRRLIDSTGSRDIMQKKNCTSPFRESNRGYSVVLPPPCSHYSDLVISTDRYVHNCAKYHIWRVTTVVTIISTITAISTGIYNYVSCEEQAVCRLMTISLRKLRGITYYV